MRFDISASRVVPVQTHAKVVRSLLKHQALVTDQHVQFPFSFAIIEMIRCSLSHLIFADDIVMVAKSPEELESMPIDIHLASKPVGLSMNLNKTKVMPNETSITSTVTVDGDVIEKVDRFVHLGKTVTQAGDLLPEIKRRISLGWAAFSKVANIMKSRKASMKIKRKVHNEYVLPVMVYGSEAWTLSKAHMELLSVAQRKMERIMLGITQGDYRRNRWIRHQTGVNDTIDVIKNGMIGGTHCTIQRQQMDKKSDRVDTTRMDKAAGKT